MQCKVFISLSAKTVQHKKCKEEVCKEDEKKRVNMKAKWIIQTSYLAILSKPQVRLFPVALTGKLNIVSYIIVQTSSLASYLRQCIMM